MSHILQKAVCT